MSRPGWVRRRAHPLLGTVGLVLVAYAVGSASVALLAPAIEATGDALPGLAAAGAGGRELAEQALVWLPVVAVTVAYGALVAGLTPSRMGFQPAGAVADAVRGLALGALIIAAPAAFGRLLGGYRPAADPAADAAVIAALIVALAIAAFAEELLMRGLLLRYWQDELGTCPALVMTAGLFAALHTGNPEVGWRGVVGILVAGLLLGVAFLRTGSLWLATGLHLGWNATTALLLGLPVSGFTLPSSWRWRPEAGWEPWLGGRFGPEEGLVYQAAAAATLTLLLLRPGRERRGLRASPPGDPPANGCTGPRIPTTIEGRADDA